MESAGAAAACDLAPHTLNTVRVHRLTPGREADVHEYRTFEARQVAGTWDFFARRRVDRCG